MLPNSQSPLKGHHGPGKRVKRQSDVGKLKAIRQELSEVSFGELQKLQEKIGSKKYHEALFGKQKEKSQEASKPFKRANKNRPREQSSKKQVTRYRNVVEVKKQMARDPRFDDLSGDFREETFDKNYEFLSDIKEREKQELEKSMKQTKDPQKQLKIQRYLYKMEQQERAKNKKDTAKELEKKYMKKEKDLVKQGKKPFFLKKSDKKKLELAEKFKALKSSGKVDNYLAKRRKKNAQKDRKKMPSLVHDES
ncbi:ribosomal RNA processing protein 36 homolog isoform X2 [Strongylocentrotus purpuratus]|uniref:rRNA biogenesis protein RRP36 n=1 Tax=Strongylocentrotus purpuratus TaxID=7668 RepID=A0A7M7PTQ3_STRPU|nr:ribosomal RNA processing protein 36 homolog isoform X2 [Strongylocentrotus purpuratus]